MSVDPSKPWLGILNLAGVASTQVGVEEAPRGSNSGAGVRRYQETTELSGTGWPWCAAFVDWSVARLMENCTPAFQPFSRPRTAAAFGLIGWARQQKAAGVRIIEPDGKTPPHVGDIVVYDFSHCGIVHDIQGPTRFSAVEGNTNGDGGREGYEVAIHPNRNLGQVRAFIRLPTLIVPPHLGGPVAKAVAAIFAALFILLGAAACTPLADTQLSNGCVIVAFNRKSVMDAHYALDSSYWRRVIIVRYKDRPELAHAYLYYEADGHGFAYDEGGTRPLTVASHYALPIGRQLAGDKLLSCQFLEPAELEAKHQP